jgi:hypothetical protein
MVGGSAAEAEAPLTQIASDVGSPLVTAGGGGGEGGGSGSENGAGAGGTAYLDGAQPDSAERRRLTRGRLWRNVARAASHIIEWVCMRSRSEIARRRHLRRLELLQTLALLAFGAEVAALLVNLAVG